MKFLEWLFLFRRDGETLDEHFDRVDAQLGKVTLFMAGVVVGAVLSTVIAVLN